MLKEALNFIRPPEDATWKEVNRWRWNVCLTLLGLILATGGLYKAKAGDKDVDQKIASAIAPITKEQVEQRAMLNRMSDLLINQLAASKAAEIRLNISKRCKATEFADRESLAREKDRLQEEYRNLKGEFYREPSCSEL